jgi:hypothetical protein
MIIEFKKQKNVFEIIPAITYYNGWGEYKRGTLTIAWLKWAMLIRFKQPYEN